MYFSSDPHCTDLLFGEIKGSKTSTSACSIFHVWLRVNGVQRVEKHTVAQRRFPRPQCNSCTCRNTPCKQHLQWIPGSKRLLSSHYSFTFIDHLFIILACILSISVLIIVGPSYNAWGNTQNVPNVFKLKPCFQLVRTIEAPWIMSNVSSSLKIRLHVTIWCRYIYLQDMWAYYCIWIVYCHTCPMTYLPPHLIHVISKTEGIR